MKSDNATELPCVHRKEIEEKRFVFYVASNTYKKYILWLVTKYIIQDHCGPVYIPVCYVENGMGKVCVCVCVIT